MATASLLGRNTAGIGTVEVLSASTARTTLGLGTLATQSGTFSGTSSGTNTGDQTITLTGDVTGSGTGSFVTSIANDSITLAKVAHMATASLLGRNTAGTGTVEVLSASTARSTLGLGSMSLLSTTAATAITMASAQPITISSGGITITNWGDWFGNTSTTARFAITSAAGPTLYSAGNVDVLHTNGSGQIMIGTTLTTSLAQLFVNALSSARPVSIFRGAAAHSANLTEWQNSSGTVSSVVTAAGNVGIGTTSPAYPLDVVGNARINGQNLYISTGGAYFAGDASGSIYQFTAPAGGAVYANVAGTWKSVLNANGLTINNGASGAGAGVGLVVASGNVGIGTTSPGYKLDVNGTGRVSGVLTANDFATTTGTFQFTSPYAGTLNVTSQQAGQQAVISATSPVGKVFYISSADALATIATQPGVPLAISTANAERIRIDTAGNVGIGTTSPNANAILDVSSTAKAFMPPRMTTTQKNAIASPTAGMVVYDSTLNKLSVRGVSAWETVTSV